MTNPQEIYRVIHTSGQLKTSNLTDLIGGVDAVEALFRQHSIELGEGYLKKALDLARTMGELWAKDNEDFQPSLNRSEQAMLLIADRMATIAKVLAEYRSPLFPEKMKLLVSNTLDPAETTVSDSRNTLFELEMLARLRTVNGSAELRPEPGADLTFLYNGTEILVECKYISGKNHKSILDRVDDACTQLASASFGLIAVELDSFVPHDVIYSQSNPQVAYRMLSEHTQTVFEAIKPDLWTLLAKCPAVKGLFLPAHSLCLANGKNCIDVGICNVANVRDTAPSASWEFALLYYLAAELRRGLESE